MRSGTDERRPCPARVVALCLLLAVLCGVAASCAKAQTAEGERHFQRGRELRQAGDLRGAKEEFRKAAEALPDSDNAFYLLALTLDDLGEWQESAQVFRKAIALNPTRGVAHHGYGNVLRRLGDAAGNLREQAEAVRLEPANLAFLVALGSAQEESNDADGARASFEKAAGLDGEPKVRATAYMRLGYLLAGQGAREQAVAALRRGVELDPGDVYANSKLKELETGVAPPPRDLRPPGKDASAGEILLYIDQFSRAIADTASDTYPVPPRPELTERLAERLEEEKRATKDPELKNALDKALRERVPFLREASRAFWGDDGGAKKNEAKPSGRPGGAGGGTGPPPPADPKP